MVTGLSLISNDALQTILSYVSVSGIVALTVYVPFAVGTAEENAESGAELALYSKVALSLPSDSVVTTGEGFCPTVMSATFTVAVTTFLVILKSSVQVVPR